MSMHDSQHYLHLFLYDRPPHTPMTLRRGEWSFLGMTFEISNKNHKRENVPFLSNGAC